MSTIKYLTRQSYTISIEPFGVTNAHTKIRIQPKGRAGEHMIFDLEDLTKFRDKISERIEELEEKPFMPLTPEGMAKEVEKELRRENEQ